MLMLRCEVCGWVYDPKIGAPGSNIPPGTAWDKVSTDFVCPICSADKNHFVPVEGNAPSK